MKKFRISHLIVGTILALALCAGSAFAQQQPSSKVTAKTANFTLVPGITNTADGVPSAWGWQTLLANKIKVANQKDLIVGASFEVGLYTKTLVRSKSMVPDTSLAAAKVEVRVVLDVGTANQKVVEPGDVVFGRRSQQLTAKLEGALFQYDNQGNVIGSCLSIVTNPDGTLGIVLDTACVTPEEIELALDTMDAATFNFVAVDVAQGVHTISVQARVSLNAEYQNGSATAAALVGKGSMTVESVRLIKGEDVEAIPEL